MSQITLRDVLKDPSVVKVEVEAKDCVDAIKKAGLILVEHGVVEERYVQAMVKTYEELGPYIVVAPGVAIPHARPEEGARKVGVSLITLKNAVNCGNAENDPVKIVIGFATPDSHQHLKIIASLAKILQYTEIIDAIAKAKKPEEIINILTGFEERSLQEESP